MNCLKNYELWGKYYCTYFAHGEVSKTVWLIAQKFVLHKDLIANADWDVIRFFDVFERHFKVRLGDGLRIHLRQVPGFVGDHSKVCWCALAFSRQFEVVFALDVQNILQQINLQLHRTGLIEARSRLGAGYALHVFTPRAIISPSTYWLATMIAWGFFPFRKSTDAAKSAESRFVGKRHQLVRMIWRCNHHVVGVGLQFVHAVFAGFVFTLFAKHARHTVCVPLKIGENIKIVKTVELYLLTSIFSGFLATHSAVVFDVNLIRWMRMLIVENSINACIS